MSEKAVSIHDMLAMIPADQLRVQFFHEGDIDLEATRRKGTRVSFYTDALTPNSVMAETEPVGLVIWIKRADWKRVVEAVKGGAK